MEQDTGILMADLSGYTAMTDVHGGAHAAEVVRKFVYMVEHSLHESARVAHRVGDQVVLLSKDCSHLFFTAHRLLASCLEAENFLSVHIAAHYGPLFMEDDHHLFGSTINVASRILARAAAGEILASAAFVDQLSEEQKHTFVSLGKTRLKNLRDEIEIFGPSTGPARQRFYVDPVCHMLVDPETHRYVFNMGHKTYHFCSLHCRDLFEANPESFI